MQFTLISETPEKSDLYKGFPVIGYLEGNTYPTFYQTIYNLMLNEEGGPTFTKRFVRVERKTSGSVYIPYSPTHWMPYND